MNSAQIKSPSLFSLLNSTFVLLTDARQWGKSLKRVGVRAGVGLASLVAPRFVLKKASDLFLTPPRFAHSAPEQRLLDAGLRVDVTTSAGHIATWRFGNVDDPVIIMSHGWGGTRRAVSRICAQAHRRRLSGHHLRSYRPRHERWPSGCAGGFLAGYGCGVGSHQRRRANRGGSDRPFAGCGRHCERAAETVIWRGARRQSTCSIDRTALLAHRLFANVLALYGHPGKYSGGNAVAI